MSRLLAAALALASALGCSAYAGQMTYTPTTGGKPVTEKSVSVPLRILGPVYQSAVKRCGATGDCDDQPALVWVAKVNGCAAIPSGVVCPR
jgi:hypothetical protein